MVQSGPEISTAPSAAGSPAPANAALPRDLVVFLSGFGKAVQKQEAEDVAARIAQAFNKQACPGAARFEVGTVERITDASGTTIGVAGITRWDGTLQTQIMDVCEVPSADALTSHIAGRSLGSKAGLVALSTLTGIARTPPGLVRLVRGKSLTWRQYLQVVWAGLVLSVLSVYLAVLLLTLLQAALAAAMAGLPEPFERYRPDIESLGAVILIAAAAVAFIPARWKEMIGGAAVDYTTSIEYFESGLGRPAAVGRIESLLNRLADEGREYRRVHVVGYSFGAIIALDAIFPPAVKPGPRLHRIDTLFTIACPFDLAHLFWRDHFTLRHAPPGSPGRWLNVVAEGDPLASNFRDSTGGTPGRVGVTLADGSVVAPQNLPFPAGPVQPVGGLLSVLLLRGLRAHLRYWDSVDPGAESCFDLFVAHVYAQDVLLA